MLTFKNAWIADGSGRDLFKADLTIRDQTILEIGAPVEEATGIDCAGLVLAPGFIDAHSHSDLQVLENKPEKLLQGVTCEVVGNCGFSTYPMSNRDQLHQFGSGILDAAGDCGSGWGWRTQSEYAAAVRDQARLSSVVSLVGHGSLRVAVAGNSHGALEARTLDTMAALLDDALAQGAAGLSTGLMYAPGSSAPRSELLRLCQIVARRNKIHCSHIRSYSTDLLTAIDEQVELAEESGCRLQISHLQAVGRRNRELNRLALDRIEAARIRGVDVMFDCYPYVAGSTVLTQLLPQWTFEGGIEALISRLWEPATRREITKQISDTNVHDWDEIFISSVASENNAWVIGMSLAQISEKRGDSPLDCALNLLIEENGQVNMLQFNQSEENLRANLTHPLSIIISDGFYVKGRPHPRLHGTFPELLGNVCRDQKWLTLPQAIHKVTGMPANRFSIAKRGLLEPGHFADLTIFDPYTVRSLATYEKPDEPPYGVLAVFREGKLLMSKDERFGAHN